MADPKGLLVVPVAFRADGSIHALELDNSDRLKVLVDSITGSVTVVQTNPANMLVGIHAWDGSTWQKVKTYGQGDIIVSPHMENSWRDTEHTQILANNTATNAEATIYTVPATKSGFISQIHVSVLNAGGAASFGAIRIYDATPTLIFQWVFDVKGTDAITSELTFNPPVFLLTGYSIRVFSNAANFTVRGAVHGLIQPT